MVVSMIWQGFLTRSFLQRERDGLWVFAHVQCEEISQVRPYIVRGRAHSQLPQRRPQFRMYSEKYRPFTQMLAKVVHKKSCTILGSTPQITDLCLVDGHLLPPVARTPASAFALSACAGICPHLRRIIDDGVLFVGKPVCKCWL